MTIVAALLSFAATVGAVCLAVKCAPLRTSAPDPPRLICLGFPGSGSGRYPWALGVAQMPLSRRNDCE